MNMILFGDGHTNIKQMDSLENPVIEKYDIVLSNIPYSQKTKSGHLYSIPTDNADSICIQHIWNSLKPRGRAAVIVPESFLYSGGAIGRTRELIVRGSGKFSVISLPRGVFMPYTPTKTNILYFEKGGEFKSAFFFVVHNDGFKLNTGRKVIEGQSDIKRLLSEVDSPRNIPAQAVLVARDAIEQSGRWNLRPFYYMEDIPESTNEMIPLFENLIEKSCEPVDPRSSPDKDWSMIQVSKNGIFLSDTIKGSECTQVCQTVKAGDIVYNPYRVNIGSIGVVPACFDGSITSPAYVVFRVKDNKIPPSYIVSILKHPRYLKVIMNYSLSSARASLPFTELTRIQIPKPTESQLKLFSAIDDEINENQKKQEEIRLKLNGMLMGISISPSKNK